MLQKAAAAAPAARTRYPRMMAHPLVVLFTLTLSPEPSLLPSSSPPSGVGVGSGSGAGVGTGAGVGAGTGADVGAGVTVPSSPQGPASFATQGSDVGNGGTA